ncbi:MAG: nuclear transport factor 2 family protein [Gammaproteobacteria bacterium]|nr:nuclear transport factor 2 family protein [Gammaproteobacteria bacterium]
MYQNVEELLDLANIRAVLETYCRGIDRLDAELISSVYWEDATDNHGVYVGPGQDFAAFIVPFLRDGYTSTMHFIGQSNIRVEGDRAAGETYFLAYHTRNEGDGAALDIAAGRYVDGFAKRGGEWRIADRVIVMDWVDTRSGLQSGDIALGSFVLGSRDASDPSYSSYGRLA